MLPEIAGYDIVVGLSSVQARVVSDVDEVELEKQLQRLEEENREVSGDDLDDGMGQLDGEDTDGAIKDRRGSVGEDDKERDCWWEVADGTIKDRRGSVGEDDQEGDCWWEASLSVRSLLSCVSCLGSAIFTM